MTKLADYLRLVMFQVKWAFMSKEVRYAYLWNRTRRLR